jgi:hypothetical protein
MIYRWLILFLMIPTLAWGQFAPPGTGDGTTNADSIKGRPVAPGGSTPSDNQILKVDTDPDPDTFYWGADNTSEGAGLIVREDGAGATSVDTIDAKTGLNIQTSTGYCSLFVDQSWLEAIIADSLDEYSLTTAIQALIEDSLNEYSLTTAIEAMIEDSLNAYLIATAIQSLIADSLDEYSLTSAIEALIADSLDEYSLTSAIEALIADSLDEYSLTAAIHDSLDATRGEMRDSAAVEIADSLDNYSLTSAIESMIEDSLNAYLIASSIQALIADSLDEYSLTSAIEALIADSLDEYSLTSAIEALIADSLDEYLLTASIHDSLNVTRNEMRDSAAVEVADSLDNYSLTSAIIALIADSLDEYSLTTAIEAMIEDSLNAYMIASSIEALIADSLDEYSLTSAIEALIADSLDEYALLDDPTFTTGITVPNNSISDEELDEAGSFTWTADHVFSGAVASLQLPTAANQTVDAEGEIAYDSDDECLRVFDGSANRAIPTYHHFDAIIYLPDSVNAYDSPLPLLTVDTLWAPFGIKITALTMATDVSTTDTVAFWEYASPDDGSPSLIDTVIVAGAYEQKETTITDSDIAANSYIYLDLSSATALDWIKVAGVYYIKTGD